MAAANDAPTDVLMKSRLVILGFREELLFIELSYLKSGVNKIRGQSYFLRGLPLENYA
jgi:hypothetical protein